MRGGELIVVIPVIGEYKRVKIGGSTSWGLAAYNSRLYIGTVDGGLIEANAHDMQLTRRIQLCKKNIYSVVIYGGVIYTSSQDMTLKAVDAATLEVLRTAKNAARGMTRLVGVAADTLVVADGGISLWDKNTLALKAKHPFPTGHFNKGVALAGETLYGSDCHGIFMNQVR